ncbi:MAG: fumarylacetoacetate hydrolase family protein [Lautropia sp.]
MKLVTFSVAGAAPCLGVQQGDRVVAVRPQLLARGDPRRAWLSDMLGLMRAGDEALRILADAVPRLLRDGADVFALDAVTLHPPFLPTTVLCAGSNYAAHNKEKAAAPLSGKEPEFFLKTADCVTGPDTPILFDARLTRKLDCETELAVVIGKPGRHIPVASALDHVFGYSIVNDVTARDLQVRRRPDGVTWYELGRGKVFDTSAPFGPCLVTADEIAQPQGLTIRTRINGELRQLGNTRDMIWSCAELIHHFSTSLTLKPGVVIITGTPAGTAWSTDEELGGRWSPVHDGLETVVPATRYCLPGDRIESEIEGIGVLRNIIADAAGRAGA